MAKYIGITIGPIFDTMGLVSTPAALWSSSYLFSYIAKCTCDELLAKNAELIAPNYEPSNELFNQNDGVGLFHDRIIFKKGDIELTDVKEIRDNVLKHVGEVFGVDNDYLKDYILFAAAVFEAENPILDSDKILNSLELSKKIVFREDANPFVMKFTGGLATDDAEKYRKKNQPIKDIAVNKLGIDVNKWALLKSKDTIKSLPHIANAVPGSDLKKYSYYAIVRSDGDNMSKIMKLLDAEGLKGYSALCLQYCSEVTKTVNKFKGVTIYSSGDDLLAIMPCDSGDGKTAFNFVREVNDKFEELFSGYINKIKDDNEQKGEDEKSPLPSLSFGITICYKSFPLYEALNDSANLLFGVAKQVKNCTAVRLQKHAGQSEGLLIMNDSLDDLLAVQSSVLAADSNSMDSILLSALYKVEVFRSLFDTADSKARVDNLFKNVFDSFAHNENDFVHGVLPEFFENIRDNKGIIVLDSDGISEKNENSAVFSYAMRMIKFFVEKGERLTIKSQAPK